MLRNVLYTILIGFTLYSISSCDEIDGPYGNQVEISEPTELTRKAVIFEFTGIHCTNCPLGHIAIDQIDSVYHGHVIPISIHAGFFAKPFAEDPDFRTPFGTKLYKDLREPSTPSFLIGSMNADDVIVGGTATWQGTVGNFIPSYTKVIVKSEGLLIDSVIKVTFSLKQREKIENSLLFYAFILEDNVEGPQSGTDIEPYIHRHMLRKCMGDLAGNQVKFIDDVASVSFSTVFQSKWKKENICIVGIIVDAQSKEVYTGEIINLSY